jgi:hypothetical protein
MKLVVETLVTSLEQEINCITDKRVHIGAIIPYLYYHNLSSGEFKFELKRDNTLIYEHLFNWQDLKGNKVENYFHEYYPIVPVDPIQLEAGSYSVTITALPGYNVDGNSFLGWIKQHEDIQLAMAYVPAGDIQNTFTIRFKEYKDGL